jgi:hypothetical protein
MEDPLPRWLEEVKRGDLVGGVSAAEKNCVQFPISDARGARTTTSSMCTFLVAVFREYWAKAERSGLSGLFYAWVDHLAGELRCSFVEGSEPSELPFAYGVKAVASPEPVAAAAVSDELGSNIPLAELKEVEWSDPDEEMPATVTVYVRYINVVR